LLLLGVNEGTKIADIFLGASKRYRGIMVLGVSTDSQDATGKVIEIQPVPALDRTRLDDLAHQFTGTLEQIPPMFSALKKDGVRLYRLARRGQEVARAPRQVRVEALSLSELGPAEIEIDVTCSGGTYVRTLAADMGAALGCGAHLKSLRRLSCGHLTIDRAVTLESLHGVCSFAADSFLSLASALGHLSSATWDHRWIARLRLGQQELLSQLGDPRAGENLSRILDHQGHLVALAEWSGGAWRLARVFAM
jgi:tRNA pseudouridine55 synthase